MINFLLFYQFSFLSKFVPNLFVLSSFICVFVLFQFLSEVDGLGSNSEVKNKKLFFPA